MPDWVRWLPTVNATLNAIATAFLLAGYRMIRQGREETHKRFMLAALATSALFLTSYVTYHSFAGSISFTGTGWIRPVYFFILITHIVLAAILPFLALFTVWRAFRGRFDAHARIARWTLPIWLYVSVTGVLVYLLLYHL